MDITLPGFKFLGHKIDNLGQKTKPRTLPRNSDKHLVIGSPIPSSPSPLLGSPSPIRSKVSPLDFRAIFRKLDNSLWITPTTLGGKQTSRESSKYNPH